MAKKIPKGDKSDPPKRRKPAANKKPAGKITRTRKTVKVLSAEVKLSELQQRFVDEYLVDLNATQAAIRAGYSIKTARQMGAENLSKPVIQAAIAQARAEQQERTGITADRVLTEAWNQVIADARELTQLVVGCCRYCYGQGHRRQRTEVERDFDLQEFMAKGGSEADFDEEGGTGFNPHLQPNSGCPECAGAGRPRVMLQDTRDLSPKAQALFAGVKQTKYGIEVQMHSKDAAMEKLFKHLGLYEKDNQQRVDPLTSLLHGIAKTSGNAFKPVTDDPEHSED